ncbi:helix-turn-helix domain-containing protein [Polaribacter uvawellassae]|uniref:helix-turn-helix domain-containing protein n=1 Tax=Polaribacter uvawellassae TaxID=3133495 RepID=UPI00321A7C66
MEHQKITQVHHINQEDLLQSFLSGVEQKLNSFKENFQPKKPTVWISRKEVGEILSISLVSVDAWTKKGILTAYRIGNKKRFKRTEVENALTKIEN